MDSTIAHGLQRCQSSSPHRALFVQQRKVLRKYERRARHFKELICAVCQSPIPTLRLERLYQNIPLGASGLLSQNVIGRIPYKEQKCNWLVVLKAGKSTILESAFGWGLLPALTLVKGRELMREANSQDPPPQTTPTQTTPHATSHAHK